MKFFSNKKRFIPCFLFSSQFGAQQVQRRPTFTQADQTMVAPQSYGRQQQQQQPFQPTSRIVVSPQQLLFDQQQQLQQKIQESQIVTEAGRIS